MASCGKWPPYESDAKRYFHENKQVLEKVREAMLEDSLDRFYGVRVRREETIEIQYETDPEVSSERENMYKSFVEKIGYISVIHFQESNSFTFGTPFPNNDVFIRYINAPEEKYDA